MAKISDMVAELSDRISLIENYPDNESVYIRLYDSVIKALPMLRRKSERKTLFSYEITGVLGKKFIVHYFSRFDITDADVMDLRNARKNPVVRIYGTTYSFKNKAYRSSILETDLRTDIDKVIQDN